MKTFKIEEYTIKVLDDHNWVLEVDKAVDLTKRKKDTATQAVVVNKKVLGYFSTLAGVKESLVELVAKKSKDFEELEKWVNKIKEV